MRTLTAIVALCLLSLVNGCFFYVRQVEGAATGLVTDALTNTPLASAQVELHPFPPSESAEQSTLGSAATTEDGRFTIPSRHELAFAWIPFAWGQPDRQVTLVVSSVGYQPARIQVPARSDQRFAVALRPLGHPDGSTACSAPATTSHTAGMRCASIGSAIVTFPVVTGLAPIWIPIGWAVGGL